MSAWVVCALCALVILKPQEFVDALAGSPIIYVAFAAALVAVAIDLVRRRSRPALAPQVPFLAGFLGWALLVSAVKHPETFGDRALSLAILAAPGIAVAVGLASPAGLQAFGRMFVACAALVTGVAIAQGNGPWVCFVGAPEDWEGKGELVADGRPCETALDCQQDAPQPGANYRCERQGPLRTASIGGRVRYRGSLSDPNELSLMIGAAIPFALALAESRRRAAGGGAGRLVAIPPLVSDRLLLRAVAFVKAIPVGLALGAAGYAVVLAHSRTGLIVFLAVLGIWFVRRVGAWGLVAACFVAPPMLLFGGRSGAEAEESSDERAGLLREAFELARATKGFGLGAGQFSEESSIGLTAHNAYVLALAETGLVGYALFGFAIYLSLKVPLGIWFGRRRPSAPVARAASALAVSLVGATIGIFFLSWTYKDVLYMLLGASIALHGAARAEDPGLDARLSLREAVYVAGGLAALLAVIYVGARLHRP